ncbi:hypothetical protein Nepgr_033522 [Nepenthes gracilis]|uniref:Uncharacterized protein n=1 Tax=Nepenthes gracilis TaxID=150966 RepID=A0AAD3Y700_NEPGR|nr:hypothetical protein Nepgr_033522 [Nepenthes gracilis]
MKEPIFPSAVDVLEVMPSEVLQVSKLKDFSPLARRVAARISTLKAKNSMIGKCSSWQLSHYNPLLINEKDVVKWVLRKTRASHKGAVVQRTSNSYRDDLRFKSPDSPICQGQKVHQELLFESMDYLQKSEVAKTADIEVAYQWRPVHHVKGRNAYQKSTREGILGLDLEDPRRRGELHCDPPDPKSLISNDEIPTKIGAMPVSPVELTCAAPDLATGNKPMLPLNPIRLALDSSDDVPTCLLGDLQLDTFSQPADEKAEGSCVGYALRSENLGLGTFSSK